MKKTISDNQSTASGHKVFNDCACPTQKNQRVYHDCSCPTQGGQEVLRDSEHTSVALKLKTAVGSVVIDLK